MAIARTVLVRAGWSPGDVDVPVLASYYICDTEAERDSVGALGDLSLARDTGVAAVRDAVGWVKSATLGTDGKVPSGQLPASQGSGVPFRDFTIAGSGFPWTNMPSAAAELGGGDFRIKADLSGFTEVRFVSRLNGGTFVSTMTLKVQYSTDESAWADLTTTVAAISTGTKTTAWAAMPAGAQADVFLRVLGAGGNGAADPRIGTQTIQVR